MAEANVIMFGRTCLANSRRQAMLRSDQLHLPPNCSKKWKGFTGNHKNMLKSFQQWRPGLLWRSESTTVASGILVDDVLNILCLCDISAVISNSMSQVF